MWTLEALEHKYFYDCTIMHYATALTKLCVTIPHSEVVTILNTDALLEYATLQVATVVRNERLTKIRLAPSWDVATHHH